MRTPHSVAHKRPHDGVKALTRRSENRRFSPLSSAAAQFIQQFAPHPAKNPHKVHRLYKKRRCFFVTLPRSTANFYSFPPNPQKRAAHFARHTPASTHEHTPFQSRGRGFQKTPRPRDRTSRTSFGVLRHLRFQPREDAQVSSARSLSALRRNPRHRTPS